MVTWKGTPLITPHDALDIVLKRVRPLEATSRPLGEALSCCLAEDVRADRDMPPADRSAMDGFAVRASDLASCPCELRFAGEVAAGSAARPSVAPGTCVRVLTGANVPPGADTVVMVERTVERNGSVVFRARTEAGSNIFRKGEDAREGDILLRKGTPLGALQTGVCAAVGKAQVKVHRRPRVSVLCTGEELRGVNDKVRPHEARNSNGPALCAALDTWGYGNVTHRTAPDDLNALTSELRKATAEHDAVILTGGVSVGKYDYVREAVKRIDAAIRFHGVAMKPGRPLLYATLADNCHIFGLPGNPLSAMTGFYEFALPALRRMSGFVAPECRPSLSVPLASGLVSKGGRVRFMLARLLWGSNGPRAEHVKSRSSADLVAGGQADGVIAVPADVRELAAGTLVEFRPWKPLP